MADAHAAVEGARADRGRPQVSPTGSTDPPGTRVGIETRVEHDVCPAGRRRAGTSDPTLLAASGVSSVVTDLFGGQVCHLFLHGEVDAGTLARLQRICEAELMFGTTTLVLDFTGMTACPSALFTVLSRIGKSCRRRSVSVELLGLREAVTAMVTSDLPAEAGVTSLTTRWRRPTQGG